MVQESTMFSLRKFIVFANPKLEQRHTSHTLQPFQQTQLLMHHCSFFSGRVILQVDIQKGLKVKTGKLYQ